MTVNKTRELELYLHIPFCVQKCKYCDFLSAPATKEVQKAYMEALLGEIRTADTRQTDLKTCVVTSIFIGGGTPSIVDAEWIVRVLDTIRQCFVVAENPEITMELNPATVTKESLRQYKAAGINRLSIGCQSANDRELELIGRIHDYRQFLDTYDMVREAGFSNVNVDLISALPGQTLADWEENIRAILSLNPPPEHISAYSLIVEENTPFYDLYRQGKLFLTDEDTEREMYWRTAELLSEAGYEQYEISNYAKEGYLCRHNCGYWKRTEYLGFGIGAASLYDNKRFQNTDSLQSYLSNPFMCRKEEEVLSLREQMDETIFLGLRMLAGVKEAEFEQRFGVSVDAIYGEQLDKSITEGLLVRREGRIFLTRRGLDLSNYVMAGFLED